MKVGFKPHYFRELEELEANNFWFCARNKIILWALGKYAPELKSFLEIGCGTGFVLSAVSRSYPNARILGSEYFDEGLQFARQRLPTAEFAQMDARNIPHEAELDAVGAFDVLEHIEEDAAVLQQIHKALKPGGLVFITVPQHRWLWSSVDEYACHVRRYGRNELDSKLLKAGFKVIRSTSFVSVLLPAMYLSRLLKREESLASDAMAELRINSSLNKLFEWALGIELILIQIGLSLPAGGSRLLVAAKPTEE